MALSVAQIDAAISAINSGGQEYRIGDRSFKRGDLEALAQLRKDAIAGERMAGGGMLQRVRFGGVR